MVNGWNKTIGIPSSTVKKKPEKPGSGNQGEQRRLDPWGLKVE